MGRYTVLLTDQARKDTAKLTPKLRKKLHEVLEEVLSAEPTRGKRLMGDLKGLRSYHLTYKDRIVYRIDESAKRVIVYRTRTHYGD